MMTTSLIYLALKQMARCLKRRTGEPGNRLHQTSFALVTLVPVFSDFSCPLILSPVSTECWDCAPICSAREDIRASAAIYCY